MHSSKGAGLKILQRFKNVLLSTNTAVIILLSGILLVVFFLASVLFKEAYAFSLDWDYDTMSKISTSIGGIAGSLWALASVILFYKAMVYQRNQANEQKGTLEQQRFENTFFNLIGIYSENVRNLSYHSNGVNCSGKDVIKEIKKRISVGLSYSVNSLPDYKGIPEFNDTTGRVNWMDENKEIFGALPIYKKFIENFLQIIKDNSPQVNTDTYLNILRAQLSGEEVFVLFYLGISGKNEYLKSLLESLAFFNGLPDNYSFNIDHKKYYNHLAKEKV